MITLSSHTNAIGPRTRPHRVVTANDGPRSTRGHEERRRTTRLRITATLLAAGEVEFGFVRDRVGLTDSALSKQLKALATAGLTTSRREPSGAVRRTWVRLTTEGRQQTSARIR
ncbi:MULTISPECIES: transcriptional regulator [unclassified Pseudonocardia]|uniref:transcriptional regulator n=1 Tax=unclassified Pseudonocardia TaxID=2619320 RepID=UPI0009EC773C|nr:transcriptional regulator [Pseudonocardia sp. EC080625-04]